MPRPHLVLLLPASSDAHADAVAAPGGALELGGGGRGERYSFESFPVRIGRDADNDLVIDVVGVSKHHAQIEHDGHRLLIRDLQSRNGVHINGARVEVAWLSPGDKLALAHFPVTCLGTHLEDAPMTPPSDEGTPSLASDSDAGLVPMIALKIEHEDGRATTFQTHHHTARIGRAEDNDVVIVRGSASRQHATISRRDGRFFIQDLQSANGTFLNGVRLQSAQPMEIGDVVTIGSVHIRLDAEAMVERFGERTSQLDIRMFAGQMQEDAETKRMLDQLNSARAAEDAGDFDFGALMGDEDEAEAPELAPLTGVIKLGSLDEEDGGHTVVKLNLADLQRGAAQLAQEDSLRATQPLSSLGKADIERDRRERQGDEDDGGEG